MYGNYFDAKTAQPDTLPLFKAPWPEQNLTQGNGPLMARYMLYGDGKVYENEPERFQFGKHAAWIGAWKACPRYSLSAATLWPKATA